MAESFEPRRADYLRYCRRPGKTARPLLWPVWVWRVFAPDPRRLQLNVFQRTVLQFARAGVNDPDEVGELMHLDPELIRYIIAEQLQAQGWLDPRGGLTAAGGEVLDEGAAVASQLHAYYLFQDAHSRHLMPRLTRERSLIEPSGWRDSGLPEFSPRRSKGKGKADWVDRPFLVRGDDGEPPPAPAANQVVEVIQRHNIALVNERMRESLGDGDDDRPWRPTYQMDEIVVEPGPGCAYLYTWLYSDIGAEHPWLVADPLGLTRAAGFMREWVEARLPRLPPLREEIQRLLGRERPQQASPQMQARHRAIEEQVRMEALAYQVPGNEEVVERYLHAVLRRRQKLEQGSGGGNHEDLDSLVNETGKLAESMLSAVIRRYPAPEEWKRLRIKGYDDRGYRQQLIAELAIEGMDDGIAAELATVRPGAVRGALEKQQGALRQLLLGALLTGLRHPEHPLWQLEGRQPGWLRGLLKLSRIRNQASHGSGQEIDRDTAKEASEFVLGWVKTIFQEL